ncbi:ATPase, F1 complex, gamma subunit domain-containing protein [Myxozyma melibiosi]|uniref:ATP synthase subunit gamma, mitochondrial n=1 Tax=Myxozyma melibiosi TaxID=54550 RepID=A0ABR1F110_9ASCO
MLFWCRNTSRQIPALSFHSVRLPLPLVFLPPPTSPLSTSFHSITSLSLFSRFISRKMSLLRTSVRPATQAVKAASARSVVASNNYATLREIEMRLKSIKNIEKITNTMKIVASTKLSRAQRAMQDSRAYGATSDEVFKNSEAKAPEEGKKLIIVSSSDKGLCGGIHSQISKAVRARLASAPDADLVVMGEKAKVQLARTYANNIKLSFNNIGKEVPTFAEALIIADQIKQLESKYDDIEIFYNHFKSGISFEPTSVPAFTEQTLTSSPNFSAYDIEEELADDLTEFSLANAIYWALAEGYACEQSARRSAMDNASKNAGDMIGRYSILYNRTRQAVITNELVDIITGASSLE